jgi:hypothetical protein
MTMNHAAFKRDATSQMVVPGQRVRLTGEAARVVPPRQPGDCEPTIELVRDGEQIRAIDIRCACGKRIYLQCEY